MDDEMEAQLFGNMGAFIKHYEFVTMQPSQYLTKGLEHVYLYDHDFCSITNQRKHDFFEFFSKGVDNYLLGDWLNAQNNLQLAS
jgi:hypothetical protein